MQGNYDSDCGMVDEDALPGTIWWRKRASCHFRVFEVLSVQLRVHVIDISMCAKRRHKPRTQVSIDDDSAQGFRLK